MPKSKPPRSRRLRPRRVCDLRKVTLAAIDAALALNEAALREIEERGRQFPHERMDRAVMKWRDEFARNRADLLESRTDMLTIPPR